MALESKPLFHPEVLRQQVRAFHLPEGVGDWQPKLQEWARLIASGRADEFNETTLLPDFLTDIFCRLLGYTGPVGLADTHNSHNSLNSHLSGTGPAAAAGGHSVRGEYTRTIEPARALAAETSKLERTLSDLVNQAYALTPAEIDLMWQTAPPRMPIPPPVT